MAIARLRSVVLDCPHPRELAEFYTGVLGGEVDASADDWVVLAVSGSVSRSSSPMILLPRPGRLASGLSSSIST